MKRISLLIALVSLFVAGGAARAQSAAESGQATGRALAQKYVIQPEAAAQNVTNRVLARDREGGLTPPNAPAVPNENPQAYGSQLSQGRGSQLASIGAQAIPSMEVLKSLTQPQKPSISLGLESNDTSALMASNLFRNPDIRRLLGDDPRFVYNPGNKPDPMLVPWVRRAAIFKELSKQAEAMVKANKITAAIKLFQRIAELRDPRFTAYVQTQLAKIDADQAKAAQAQLSAVANAEAKIELPGWVKTNTTGAIVTPNDSMCLVGDYMLHTGESIPSYPEVHVAAITPSTVTYRVKDKTFEVSVRPNQDTDLGGK